MKTKTVPGTASKRPSASVRRFALSDTYYSLFYGILIPFLLAIILYSYEKETLYRIQELSLFLPGEHFYDTFATYPGGTLQWMACFFTQFFYKPWIGAGILAVLWMGIFYVLHNLFRLPKFWGFITTLGTAAMVASITQMGYFIYYITLQGYFFVLPLGFLLSLMAWFLFSRIERYPIAALVWMVVWTAVGYPLLGAYALLGTAYMIFYTWCNGTATTTMKTIQTVSGILFCIGVPLIAWYCYSQTSISEIYTASLPSFHVYAKIYWKYRIPYFILFAMPVVLAIVKRLQVVEFKKAWLAVTLHAACLIVAGYGLKQAWYHDDNFRLELKMLRAIEEQKWEDVPLLYKKAEGETTRMMVMYKNLALFRLGRAGDEIYHYREGGAQPNAPFSVRLVQLGGKALYYNYGQENFCYRWCMEDAVCYGWKVEYLKYMAKTSIARGELKVAEKYLHLLSQTLYHKEWANHYARFLKRPSEIYKDSEFAPILALMPAVDNLSSDQSVIELFLMHNFVNFESQHPLYHEQALLAAMQLKDIDTFWRCFFQYAESHRNQRMPRHYQEAAYLYGHLEDKVDIKGMPFDKEVINTYNKFMEFANHCGGMSDAQVAEAFRPQFGHTFYYFYFLVNGLKTY